MTSCALYFCSLLCPGHGPAPWCTYHSRWTAQAYTHRARDLMGPGRNKNKHDHSLPSAIDKHRKKHLNHPLGAWVCGSCTLAPALWRNTLGHWYIFHHSENKWKFLSAIGMNPRLDSTLHLGQCLPPYIPVHLYYTIVHQNT